MKSGVAFIAFSLHPDDDDLHVSSLDGHRVERNQICESTFADLEFFNDRGLEEAATMIGKKVLVALQLEHPEKFKRYPNLVAEIPSKEEVADMNEKLRFMAADEGSSD